MGFRALIRVFQLLTCIIFCATIIASLDSWTPDPAFLQVTDGDCDFPIYNWNESRVAFEDMLDFPYVVRGANLEWPAFRSWRKRELLNAFGSRVVRSGSESSIVHSGGVAERESTLQDVVESMEAIASGQQDGTFIFDTTILRVIPELNRDFSVPSIFRKWDNPENETRAAMWHMLSLGPTQSGLPFHNHGKTWLAVIHGIKQWFIYPPGFDPPHSVDSAFSPMLPVLRWVKDVYRALKRFPKPPIPISPLTTPQNSSVSNAMIVTDEEGYRPLECRQFPGDILFLPSRWTHLTLNIGETIAIGGQESLLDDSRYSSAEEVLQHSPRNYDAWKDLGLAQFNMASRELKRLREQARVHQPGEIVFIDDSPLQLDALLEATGDTWVVLYFDSLLVKDGGPHAKGFPALKDAWNTLAANVHDIVNVAVVDLHGNYTTPSATAARIALDQSEVRDDPSKIRWTERNDDVMYVVDAQHQYLTLPVAKLHRGMRKDQVHDPSNTFTPHIAGIDFGGSIANAANVERVVREAMDSAELAPGSLSSTPAIIQRALHEAIKCMKRALEIKPLQPELRNMIGDVAGLAKDFGTMHEVLEGNTAIVDRLAAEGLTPISLASMYHKIGHNYIKLQMGKEALLPTQKALQALPSFLPAMYDMVFTYVLLGDRGAAEFALEQLRLVVRDWARDENAVRLERQVAAMEW